MLEMLVSLAVLLVVSGAAFSALIYYQKSYGSEQLKADMHSSMRGAIELMTQEIGQAGCLNFAPRTLGAAVTASTSAQTVVLTSPTTVVLPSSAADIFVGEQLLVDTGAAQERVQVMNVLTSSITGVFKNNHLAGAPIAAVGVFPQGILSSSTATQLKIFGDINADGKLVYVQYTCDTAAGTLTRSTTPISAGAINPGQVLVQNLVPNPGGTACFQYASSVTSNGFTFVPSVAVTMTIQTSERDPQTGQFVTMTKSFLKLASRNILAGLSLAQANQTDSLQPTPPGLPLH